MKAKHLLLLLVSVVLIVSCEKYVTPNKIKRHITKGTWRVAELVDGDTNATPDYSNWQFTFGDNNKLSISGDTTLSGTWKLGEEKNPTLFFISLPLTDKSSYFVDDWLVYGISRTELYMTRNDPNKPKDLVRFRLNE